MAGQSAELQAEVGDFVAVTSLPNQPEFAPLFGRAAANLFIVPPSYKEPVMVSPHEIVIDRVVSYELAPGVCQHARNRRVLGDLCFTVEADEPITTEVATHLQLVRQRLAAAPSDQILTGTITVAQAQNMSDMDLLELTLNAGPGTVRRTTRLPRSADGGLVDLGSTGTMVATALGSSSAHSSAGEASSGMEIGPAGVAPFDFATEYFLTGQTVTHEFSESWSYEKDSWWYPRIYVGFSYDFLAAFGVRAPFSVDVDYLSGDADETLLAISVDPVSLDEAAAAVGLDDDLYFDGQEFVLELQFDCKLEASVAGFGDSVECDDFFSVDTSFSRDFDPVIGNEERTIENWWLWQDGASPISAEIFDGAVWGEAILGTGVDVVDGRIEMQLDGTNGTAVTTSSNFGLPRFESRLPHYATVARESQWSESSIALTNPTYGFDVVVRPKIKFNAGIDFKLVKKSWTFIWALDMFSFGVGFQLDHHDGTVDRHDYQLYDGVATSVHTGTLDQDQLQP